MPFNFAAKHFVFSVLGNAFEESAVCKSPLRQGLGNSMAFKFSVFKALLDTLNCGDKLMVKFLLKAPPEQSPLCCQNQPVSFSWQKVWLTRYS